MIQTIYLPLYYMYYFCCGSHSVNLVTFCSSHVASIRKCGALESGMKQQQA